MTDILQFPGIPSGWFAVATSPELKPGKLLTRRYFGRDLIVYRTESGEARVTDAHCPHLGAHLGGGQVSGEVLRCPFHGFEFGQDGRCTKAYGKALPRKATLGTWQATERNGYIFAWHHAQGEAPDWDIPTLPVEGWTANRDRMMSLRSHPQETSENSVDIGHFTIVHNFAESWLEGDLEIEGPLLKGAYGVRWTGLPMVNLVGVFGVEVHGLGYSLVRIDTAGFQVHLLVLSTPIDDQHIDLRIGVSVRHRALPGLSHLMREFLSSRIFAEVSQDAPIWEAKRYIERPSLAEGDGPIAAYRRYCEQFYPPKSESNRSLPQVDAA